jgi:hypothetical protein
VKEDASRASAETGRFVDTASFSPRSLVGGR